MANKQDPKDIKAKAFAVRALMNNKKFARQISDMWDAPVGSTKSAQAKALLSSIYKSRNNFNYASDGRGAGETFPFAGMNPLGFSGSGNNSSMSGIGVPKQIKTIDGMGMLKIDPATGNIIKPNDQSAISANNPFLNPNSGYSQLQQTFKNTTLAPGNFKYSEIPYKEPDIKSGIIGADGKEVMLPGATNFNKIRLIPKTDQYYDYTKVSDKLDLGLISSLLHPGSKTTTTIKDPNMEKRFITFNEIDIYDKSNMERPLTPDEAKTLQSELGYTVWDDLEKASGTIEEYDGTKGVDILDKEYNEKITNDILNNQEKSKEIINNPKTDPQIAGYMQDVLDLYASGLGPTGTFYALMNDKKKLANLLGISDAEAAMMPGSSLATSLIDLRKNLELSADLDNRSAKIQNMILQGANVESDFRAYIRGKDKYLGTIEKMQSDFETQLARMDTSNPYVAQRMENYSNYLTILQGRQNQRYIDFLNAGTKEYQTQIDQLTTLYEADSKRVEEIYKDQAALTAEKYTMIKDMVKELWDNVDSREEKANAKEKFQWEKEQAAADTAYKWAQVNAENTKAGETKIQDLASADIDAIKGRVATFDEENKRWVLNDFDPYSAINKAASIGKTNPQAAFDTWLSLAGEALDSEASSGAVSGTTMTKLGTTMRNLTPDLKSITGMSEDESVDLMSRDKTAYEAKIAALNPEQKDAFRDAVNDIMYRDAIQDKVSDSLYSNIIKKLEDATKLQNAVNDLTYGGVWGSGTWIKDKSTFVRDHTEAFGADLAEKMYDAVMANVNSSREQNSKSKIESIKNMSKKDILESDRVKSGKSMKEFIAGLIATYIGDNL